MGLKRNDAQASRRKCYPIQLPIGAEEDFSVSLIWFYELSYADDLGTRREETDIPSDMLDEVAVAREALLEAAAEVDEELMIKYLEGEELSVAEIKAALRRGTIATKIVPVLCGSSFKNKGVQPLLDAVVDFLPAPSDLPPVEGTDLESGEAVVRPLSDDGPFSALAFKIMTDPYVGKLAFFRVYSGVLKAGSYIYNSSKGKKERIGRILQMHANHREERDVVYSGEIAAAVGLRSTTTGDTLCDEEEPIVLESLVFPAPVLDRAIEPRTKADQDKLSIGLQRLAEEDPTFQVRTDEETGQTIISGMGELHLEVIVDRMLREFNVQANVGKPQVAYRETIRKAVRTEGRFIRQSGGRGQYGHIVLELEPRERGAGFEFESKIVGGAVPKDYLPAVEEGVRESMSSGILAGYPMVDVKVTAVDGSYHEVDSSEIAFKIAGSVGFRDGAKQADPVLLEPIMKVEVVTPEEFLGDVLGNLNARRGRIEGMETRGTAQNINALVPLREMFGYATDLRSMTQGRATYVMSFAHYDEAPTSIAELVTKV